MKAETTRSCRSCRHEPARCGHDVDPAALCQVALKHFGDGEAFRPSCASEITSLTPLKPRRVKAGAGTSVQIGLGLGCSPTSMPKTSRLPSLLTPDGDDDGNGDDAPATADFQIGGINPQRGPVTLDRAGRGRPSRLPSISSHSLDDLAFGDAAHAHGFGPDHRPSGSRCPAHRPPG